MTLTINSNAPYAPGGAIVSLLKRFRDKGLSFPVTAEVLIRAGVAESLVPRTYQSLQLLELIDESGEATEVLKKIRSVPEKEYKQTLAAWIKQVYAEVFLFVDPATASDIEMHDSFRGFQPEGQRARMVSLFMGLCAEAGLAPESKKVESKARARNPAGSTSRITLATSRVVNRKSEPAAHLESFRAGMLAPELAGLMARLPQNGWTKATRDRFVKTFESVLDYVIPIVAKEPAATEDDS
jgi:hypothetical protein